MPGSSASRWLTSTGPWSRSVATAFALAGPWGSHVTGCFIDPALLALRGVDEEPSVLSLLLELPREAEGDAKAFEELARRQGVRSTAWMSAQTGLARTMHQLGAWHDLFVLERDITQGDGSDDLLGEAVLGCRKPCLLLPHGNEPQTFARVMLAWNGSLEATRAIHASLPCLARAREVVVVDGAPPPEDDGGPAPYFHPIEYLARHGIVARRRSFHATVHGTGDALLHEAQRMDSDLLVMGAYGHPRLRERVLGSATRRILQQATLPVLMQH